MSRGATSSVLGRVFIVPSVIVIGLMLLPVVVVLGISLGPSATYEFPPSGLTLKWFASFLSTESFFDSMFQVSLPLAVGVAFTSTVLGTLAAIGMARSRHGYSHYVELLFAVPIVFPQILLGVGLFLLYARLGITPSLLSLGFGHVLIATPYVIRTVLAGLFGIDARLEEAAQNLGAAPVRAFCLVTLPLLRSGIISGAIFAFIISFSDINLALFLSSANTTTLPIQILSQMQYTSDPTIAAAATLQVVVVSLLVLSVQRIVGTVRF